MSYLIIGGFVLTAAVLDGVISYFDFTVGIAVSAPLGIAFGLTGGWLASKYEERTQ